MVGRDADDEANGFGEVKEKEGAGLRVPSDVISASSGSGMLFRDIDRDRVEDRSARVLVLGPASGGSSGRADGSGRSSEGRGFDVMGNGTSCRGGGGADSERCGGTCMVGGGSDVT